MSDVLPTIDVILPAHNEAKSISHTLREFYESAVAAKLNVRFIVCEDGSTDGTPDVIRQLQAELPIELISSTERKGYSRAVVDGFEYATADLIGFVDSDGQCDPQNFAELVHACKDVELAMGYRNPRIDHWIRKRMSQSFGLAFGLFFSVPFKDPSCPYLVMRREAVGKIFRGTPGILKQGFWWEFCARVVAAKVTFKQLPVRHRARLDGQTQVYLPSKVPGIAWRHLMGLFRLKREIREFY